MSNPNQSEQRFQTLPNVMQKNADTFWKAQADILDGMQDFAAGWLQRRHIGVQAPRLYGVLGTVPIT